MRTGAPNPQNPQAKLSVPALVRVEVNPNAAKCRLSVRTMHPTVTGGLKSVLQQQLSKAAK